MPFCVQCGTSVSGSDQFCGKCGSSQTGAAKRTPADYWNGISSRNAALLCYIPWIGWIASILILASDRFRTDSRVRFHAFQGLYLFAVWLMLDWVVSPMLSFPPQGYGNPFFGSVFPILRVLIVAAWILMLVKVSQGEDYHLPLLGELADRSVSEQRS